MATLQIRCPNQAAPSPKKRERDGNKKGKGSASVKPPCCDWRGPLGDVATHKEQYCELEVLACIYDDKGCKEELPAYQMMVHQQSCAFRTARCVQCKCILLATTMAAHLAESCIAVRVRCAHVGCSFGAPRGKMDAHEALCGHALLTCPVDGCGASVKRRALSAHIASTNAAHVKLLAAHFQELLEAAEEDEEDEEDDEFEE